MTAGRKALSTLLFCVAALSACATSVQSGPSVAPAAAPAKSDQAVPEQLRYFTGTWLVTAVDPGTKEATTVSYRVEPSAGGRWLSGSGESADLSVRVRDVWGLDAASGDILRYIFDGSGAHGIVRSRGWDGDRLILEGEAQSKGGSTKVRETITRVGPDRFNAVWEALQDGVWRAYSVEEVRRQ
jgi:hypothetical protein